jgi:hypothetical protein
MVSCPSCLVLPKYSSDVHEKHMTLEQTCSKNNKVENKSKGKSKR